MTTTFVGCDQTTRITPEDKFRLSFGQGTIEQWLAGGTMQSVYQSLSVSPWGYVVSEPPVDSQPVLVVDFRISHGTVGSSPPGTVADLLNALEDLTFYNAYDVTRIEKLSTTSPLLEQRSQVIAQALADQRSAGFDPFASVTQAFGGVKGIVIAVAVLAAAVAVIVTVKAARTATA